MKKDLPSRRKTRLHNFDYSKQGAYFITVCTEGKRRILSEIVAENDTAVQLTPDKFVGDGVLDIPKIKLLKYGEIVDKYIRQLNDFYDNISVERYVIMPNHIHMIVFVKNVGSILNNIEGDGKGQSRTPVPTVQNSTVSKFISTFKRFCNKEYGYNIWQRSYYDHIIRDQHDYDKVAKYIYENPIKWRFNNLNE